MYRLEVKCGKKWKLGWNVYSSYEDALARKEKMELVGHKVRIVKTDW